MTFVIFLGIAVKSFDSNGFDSITHMMVMSDRAGDRQEEAGAATLRGPQAGSRPKKIQINNNVLWLCGLSCLCRQNP